MLLGKRLGQHIWDQVGFEEYTGDGAGDLACQAGINCLCFKCLRNGGRKHLDEEGDCEGEAGQIRAEMSKKVMCCVSKYRVMCPTQQMPPSLLQSTWNSISGPWVSGFVCYQQIATASIGKAFRPLWKSKLSPKLVVPFGLISLWLASMYHGSKLTVN